MRYESILLCQRECKVDPCSPFVPKTAIWGRLTKADSASNTEEWLLLKLTRTQPWNIAPIWSSKWTVPLHDCQFWRMLLLKKKTVKMRGQRKGEHWGNDTRQSSLLKSTGGGDSASLKKLAISAGEQQQTWRGWLFASGMPLLQFAETALRQALFCHAKWNPRKWATPDKWLST